MSTICKHACRKGDDNDSFVKLIPCTIAGSLSLTGRDVKVRANSSAQAKALVRVALVEGKKTAIYEGSKAKTKSDTSVARDSEVWTSL